MKRAFLVIAAASALAMAGCATPTPYQPDVRGNAQSGGFRDVQIEPGRWRVTFSGNTMTSRQTVESYLLYRAAELTVDRGYDWFATTDRRTDKSTRYEVDPFYETGFGQTYGLGWRPYWRYSGRGYGWRTWDPWMGDPFWADHVAVDEITSYEASAEIAMGHGTKPAIDPKAFDARAVLTNLGPGIIRPAP